ncbi:MAG: SRPBCC family protein [Planctomycetota bacterium]
MTTIEEHVDVEVPAASAYAQWTQFEDMPDYLDHVRSVEQVDDRHLRWTLRTSDRLWEGSAEITEQIPDKRIAWVSQSGIPNAGCVTFHRLSDDACRVMLQMEIDAAEVPGSSANPAERISDHVAAHLTQFKGFLESRDAPTGRWSGSIPSPDERTTS